MELIKIENQNVVLNGNTSKQLAYLEMQLKELKEIEDNIKSAILIEMEEKNIIKIDTMDLTITYIAPSDRETFNQKAFKEKHADIFDKYVKMTPIKSSIRIKVKE